ncbi:MAG: magnesium transporter CorA family protein [Cyanobacteria bacterium]|nr:magnesium transporter CorA family protein [Cyanobacteriota bacterium]
MLSESNTVSTPSPEHHYIREESVDPLLSVLETLVGRDGKLLPHWQARFCEVANISWPNTTKPHGILLDYINCGVRIMLMHVVESGRDYNLLWMDFEGDSQERLKPWASQFSFEPFIAITEDSDSISYERPCLTENSVQLTAYYLVRSNPENKAFQPERQVEMQHIHVYTGTEFMITIHEDPLKPLCDVQSLLCQSHQFKTPAALLNIVLEKMVHLNQAYVDSMRQDVKQLSSLMIDTGLMEKENKRSKENSAVFRAFIGMSHCLLDVETVLIQQKRVLQDLLMMNQINPLDWIRVDEIDKKILQLETSLDTLEVLQEEKNGLIDLYRAQISNSLDLAMRRLAAIGTILAPPGLMAAIYGMNVPLPFTTTPHAFLILMSTALVVSGGCYFWLREKDWF